MDIVPFAAALRARPSRAAAWHVPASSASHSSSLNKPSYGFSQPHGYLKVFSSHGISVPPPCFTNQRLLYYFIAPDNSFSSVYSLVNYKIPCCVQAQTTLIFFFFDRWSQVTKTKVSSTYSLFLPDIFPFLRHWRHSLHRLRLASEPSWKFASFPGFQ